MYDTEEGKGVYWNVREYNKVCCLIPCASALRENLRSAIRLGRRKTTYTAEFSEHNAMERNDRDVNSNFCMDGDILTAW